MAEHGWLLQELTGFTAELPRAALGITLPLAELFNGIELPHTKIAGQG